MNGYHPSSPSGRTPQPEPTEREISQLACLVAALYGAYAPLATIARFAREPYFPQRQRAYEQLYREESQPILSAIAELGFQASYYHCRQEFVLTFRGQCFDLDERLSDAQRRMLVIARLKCQLLGTPKG